MAQKELPNSQLVSTLPRVLKTVSSIPVINTVLGKNPQEQSNKQTNMDALVSTERTMPNGKQIVTLYTGKPEIRALMKPLCLNVSIMRCYVPYDTNIRQDQQKGLEAKRSVDVEAYKGKVDPFKVATRPSYLNGVLIQSRGRTGMTCTACMQNPERGPFTDCRRAAGYFEGACGNCKWRDHGARCTVRNPTEGDDGWEHPAVVTGTFRGEEVELIQLE